MDADKQPSERDDFSLGVRCNSIPTVIAVPRDVNNSNYYYFGGKGYQLLLHPILSAGNVAENLSNGLEKILVIPKQ